MIGLSARLSAAAERVLVAALGLAEREHGLIEPALLVLGADQRDLVRGRRCRRACRPTSPGSSGAQPVVHSAAFGPPFHGLRTSGAIAATPRPRPKMPAAAPAERMISSRRAMPVSLPAAASCAMTVLRATSSDGPVVPLLHRDLVREELLHVRDHRDAQREHAEAEECRRSAACRGRRSSSRVCRAPRTRAARTGSAEERQRRQRRDEEPQRDRALGAPLGAGARHRPLRACCGRSRRRRARRRAAPAPAGTSSVQLGGAVGSSAVSESASVRGGHDLAPSHSANPISPASPTMKAMRPSDTGPIPPSG